jgi:hypothetical protein
MTITRTTLAHVALAGLLLAGGCGRLRAANAAPAAPIEGELTMTLQQAEREVLASRFGVADRLLAGFAETHATLPEAVEAGFWRALFMLDAANQTAGPRDAMTLLDGYLAAGPAVAHRGAATSLRRIAVALVRPAPVTQAAAPTAPSARTEPKPAARTEDKSRDDEVQRLKEELAKANAELERIKKRLTQPNP